MKSTVTNWGEFRCFIHTNLQKFILLTAAFVLMLSVIGLQGVPFWDDSRRRLSGLSGWGPWDGRWGSEFVSWALNSGRSVVDLGLTPFVISGLVMALASTIVIWALAGASANWITWLLALTFGLNPWVLNALAFRFDGPFMALSVLFAVSIVFFYRARLLLLFTASLLLAFVTANFFQSAIGLILTLLMTKSLLDWFEGRAPGAELLRRLGLAFAGVAVGVLLYFGQTLILGAGRTGWFDLSNPFGAFPNNLFHFLRVFVRDSAPSWLFFTALVVALAIYTLLRRSRQGILRPLLVLSAYFIISVLASGGILLFATAEHISVQARFRFPLAMGIAMLAIIASTIPKRDDGESNKYYWPLPLVAKIALLAFSYLWVMPVFLFANVLSEQHNALRFQAPLVFSDAFSLFQPGDTILYEPNILTNSLTSQRVAERFPIFDNTSYIGVLNLHNDNVRERLTEALGLGANVLLATHDSPGTCDLPELAVGPRLTGPRWETWRADEDSICVTFPAFGHLETNTPEIQIITLDLNTFPFEITGGPDLTNLGIEDVEVALWSLINPEDIQWVRPDDITEGIATFIIPAPITGWEGSTVAAHFFLDGNFMFQQIWRIQQ